MTPASLPVPIIAVIRPHLDYRRSMEATICVFILETTSWYRTIIYEALVST
jgi:hypothetical protein